MNASSRASAAVVYFLPAVGWLYVFFFERKNKFAIYHLRQAIGLVLFLLGIIAGWGIVTWILAWIPYMFIVGIALFTLVITAFLFCIVLWAVGLSNALNARTAPIPVVGQWANSLPIQ